MQSVFEKARDFKIIDFHTHPFTVDNNICAYRSEFKMSTEDIKPTLEACGIGAICGSVVITDGKDRYENVFAQIKEENRTALALRERLGGFYIPGIHVHPHYIDESIEEIRTMSAEGVRLIGELVPSMHGYDGYTDRGLHPILDEAARHSMVISYHTMNIDTIDEMVGGHKDVAFVAAHPGERAQIERHIEKMMKHKNLFLDISGTGIFRYLALSYLVKKVGSERILFGTDYPICNPGVYIGGVLAEGLRDSELENIFHKNAEKILNLK